MLPSVTRHQRTSFSTRAKFTFPPPFAATFAGADRSLISWRERTHAILFRPGRSRAQSRDLFRVSSPPALPTPGHETRDTAYPVIASEAKQSRAHRAPTVEIASSLR